MIKRIDFDYFEAQKTNVKMEIIQKNTKDISNRSNWKNRKIIYLIMINFMNLSRRKNLLKSYYILCYTL